MSQKRIIFENYLSPGDIVCMTAGIRDLHENHPHEYLTEVRTASNDIWENNKYVTKFDDEDNEVDLSDLGGEQLTEAIYNVWDEDKIPKIELEYPLIHRSNTGPNHFTEGYTDSIERVLNIRIRDRLMRGHIDISEDERQWVSQVQEITNRDTHYWIVVNGGKMDFTAKWWDPIRMQHVVNNLPGITFVQVGSSEHYHVPLYGNNVINLIDKTNMRELIRLTYHSSGVITPVSLMMHLAAAVPVRRKKTYGRLNRPCVVIAGGREPSTWEAYCNHAYLHTCGMLSCCDNGGCWKSRTVPIGDGDDKDNSLCLFPEVSENGITIPACLKMITVDKVVSAVKDYLP